MRYCGIKHKAKSERTYYFKLPNELSHARVGDYVTCNTKRGRTSGVIVSITEADSDADFCSVVKCKMPIRYVSTVGGKMLDTAAVKIPLEFRKKKPSNDKLIRRVMEFAAHKGFDTKIVVDTDGYIVDGYSAFLTAQFLGLKKFGPCIIVDGNNTTEEIEEDK